MTHPATRICARFLAIYLVFWAISDALSLPRDLVHVLHYAKTLPDSAVDLSRSYWFRIYMLQLLENIIRIALWLLSALWLAECGPRVQKLLNKTFGNSTEATQ